MPNKITAVNSCNNNNGNNESNIVIKVNVEIYHKIARSLFSKITSFLFFHKIFAISNNHKNVLYVALGGEYLRDSNLESFFFLFR